MIETRPNIIGIIGAGTMGVSLAIDLAFNGQKSILIDVSDQTLKYARERLLEQLRFAPLLSSKLVLSQHFNISDFVTFSTDLKDLGECRFIVENITESSALKSALYERMCSMIRPDCVVAANTSCISITTLGGSLADPSRLLGIHFMNPVYLKNHVEMIRGYYTSESTMQIAAEFLRSLKKTFTLVNDFPGFVSNRISHLFMNEAFFTVQDQVAEPVAVDEIFRKCFGHKMGPLETADLIGLDTVLHSLTVLYQSYQDPKYRACPLLRKYVDAGRLGRKSGRGFYQYQ